MERDIPLKPGCRSHSGLKLLAHLFKNPVVNVKNVEELCGLSKKSANELINIFEEQKWLQKISVTERYRRFLFTPYLKLFES